MTFADIVAYLISIINSLVFVLGGLAVVVFLWGVVDYVRKAASAKKGDRTKMLWSLLALFVLFSVWGILGLMCASFSLCGAGGSSGGPTNIVPAGGAWYSSGPSGGSSGGTAGNLTPIY